MHAGLGDAAAAFAQHFVGRGGAVAAHDLDRLLRVEFGCHLPHDVEQAGIHAGLLLATPIAEEPIDFLQRFFVVAAVALVGDGDALVGVHVMHRERARIAIGDRRLQALATEEDKERRQANAAGDARSSGQAGV